MYRFAKRLTAILFAACFLSAAAAPEAAARSPRILLMCCYQQEGWGNSSSATFLDDEGRIWRYESDGPLPDTEEARLAFLAETDRAVPIGQMDFWRLLDLLSLIQWAQPWPLEPQPPGAADYGLNTYSAVRYGADASAEVIPLAVSGDRTAENLEPNAYALYVALFREIAVHETADPTWLQPMNIPREPLAAFFGLEETLFQDATLTLSFFDPQWGEREYPLEEGEMREKLHWLAGLTVTVKQSALPYGEPTCVYRLYSPQGEELAAFQFFHDLLLTGDGLYAVEMGGSQTP